MSILPPLLKNNQPLPSIELTKNRRLTMNNKNRIKLIASGITLCCCAAAVGAVSVIRSRNGDGAAPAAILQENELPVIVLDAGHGEST